MEIDKQPERQKTLPERILKKNKTIKLVLNLSIALSLIIVIYFGYAYVSKSKESSADEKKPVQQQRIIQLDVLNGCGAKGVGAKFTDYLRSKGFDVVEMKNYKSFQIPQTLVVDRVGDLSVARKVAAALGISEKNIVQQINPDYFVDVSVIIGKDHTRINLSH